MEFFSVSILKFLSHQSSAVYRRWHQYMFDVYFYCDLRGIAGCFFYSFISSFHSFWFIFFFSSLHLYSLFISNANKRVLCLWSVWCFFSSSSFVPWSRYCFVYTQQKNNHLYNIVMFEHLWILCILLREWVQIRSPFSC